MRLSKHKPADGDGALRPFGHILKIEARFQESLYRIALFLWLLKGPISPLNDKDTHAAFSALADAVSSTLFMALIPGSSYVSTP